MEDNKEVKISNTLTNKYMWFLILAYLFIFFLLEEFFKIEWRFSFIILPLINGVLFYFDEKNAKENGINLPNFIWGIFFLPVYLVVRYIRIGKRLKHYYLVVWAILLILPIWAAHLDYRNKLEQTACQAVTHILKKDLGKAAPRCLQVKLGKKSTENFYNATAILYGSERINILLELQDGRLYDVRISG